MHQSLKCVPRLARVTHADAVFSNGIEDALARDAADALAGEPACERQTVGDILDREDACLRRLEVEVVRSEEHTSELQSLMRISYAVFCLKKKNKRNTKKEYTSTLQQKSNHRKKNKT